MLDWRPHLGNWLIVFGLFMNGVSTVVMTILGNFVLMCLLMAFTGFLFFALLFLSRSFICRILLWTIGRLLKCVNDQGRNQN